MRRSPVTAVVSSLAVLALVGAFALARTPQPPPTRARGGADELLEQATVTEQRLTALALARAEGRFGQDVALSDPAPGWAGERLMNPGTDDWEPAVAADPNRPFVYLLATRYGAGKPCKGNCPNPWIVLEVSRDGGRTWGAGRPLCACKGSGQYDPLIEVVPENGDVYAAYMNGYNVVFVRSTDHGRTWSAPVPTWGKVSWGDKPILATSADGRHVYIAFNGPQGGDAWIAVSHDRGRTWSQTKVAESKSRYFFAYDATVLPDGTVVFAQSSVEYQGGDGLVGVTRFHAFVSTDRGRTWRNVVVDTVQIGQPCADCRADYYVGHASVSSDAAGRLVYVYDGATEPYGPQRIYVRRSTDRALSWSARTALSPATEHATSPALEMSASGEVHLWYAHTNGLDVDAWNTWYRSSPDGGRTWSAPVKISDAAGGPGYKTARGYAEIYGDYGEMAITSEGAAFAVWGEAYSYIGPGGIWFNRRLVG